VDTEIREVGPDDKISIPGFYRIPLKRHHSQCCDGVSVTSSILRRMIPPYTPADVWAFHDLNPERYERPTSPALRQGAAMAALIEGGEEALDRDFFVMPKDKPNRPSEAQLKSYAEKRASFATIRAVKFWQERETDERTLHGAIEEKGMLPALEDHSR
jgi:hypothetical protein